MTILLDAARYAAVNAQTRGLLARLIADTLWTELITASTLDEQIDVLGRSGYMDRMADVASEPDVAHLERALWSHLASASRLPLSLMQGASRALLEWYWRRFEVDNLKTSPACSPPQHADGVAFETCSSPWGHPQGCPGTR